MQKNLNILSLNIGHGMLMDELIAYISSKTATEAVFCFQEADGAAELPLDDLLSRDYRGFFAEKFNGEDRFRLATYVRRDITVTASKVILPDLELAGIGLVCTLQLEPNVFVSVTNSHGTPRPGTKLDTPIRIAQSQGLLRSSLQNKGTNIFIGDFNLQPYSLSVDLFAKNGYRNLIDEFKIPTTRNEIVWRKYPDTKQLFADYAFLEQDSPLTYDFHVEDVIVSDHLPLLLALNVPAVVSPALTRDLVSDVTS